MFFKRSPKKVYKEDIELLILFKESGDIAVLGELFDRYIHLVFGICMKYLKNKEESKDMVMQVFEKLAIELKKQEVKNFKSWLHVLVRNECFTLLRSSKYKKNKEHIEIFNELDMEYIHQLHPIEEELDLELNLQEMEKAIQVLPAEQKECIQLFYFKELCYKEIADLTGYELKKVKSSIQNGKRNLKIYLQKTHE